MPDFEIKELRESRERAEISEKILRQLPEWFGTALLADWIAEAEKQSNIFYCVYAESRAVGYILLKPHNKNNVEIYTLAILKDYHNQGIGKTLIKLAEDFCERVNADYLTVKTVGEPSEFPMYKGTRDFYMKMGFKELEVFTKIWKSPCLYLIKNARTGIF